MFLVQYQHYHTNPVTFKIKTNWTIKEHKEMESARDPNVDRLRLSGISLVIALKLEQNVCW